MGDEAVLAVRHQGKAQSDPTRFRYHRIAHINSLMQITQNQPLPKETVFLNRMAVRGHQDEGQVEGRAG